MFRVKASQANRAFFTLLECPVFLVDEPTEKQGIFAPGKER